jgi:hypothetical protein
MRAAASSSCAEFCRISVCPPVSAVMSLRAAALTRVLIGWRSGESIAIA